MDPAQHRPKRTKEDEIYGSFYEPPLQQPPRKKTKIEFSNQSSLFFFVFFFCTVTDPLSITHTHTDSQTNKQTKTKLFK